MSARPQLTGHRDAVGRRIAIGDTVACARSGYAMLTVGTVVDKTAKEIRVRVPDRALQQSRGPQSLATGDTFPVDPSQSVVTTPCNVDHMSRCCVLHGTHVESPLPHQGCMLR